MNNLAYFPQRPRLSPETASRVLATHIIDATPGAAWGWAKGLGSLVLLSGAMAVLLFALVAMGM
jgi:hypothetical protein